MSLAQQVRRLLEDPEIVVLEGFHAVKHALRFSACIELAVSVDPAHAESLAGELAPDVLQALRQLVREVDAATIALAAPRVPRTGIVAFARRPSGGEAILAELAPDSRIILLEDPRDLGNVGAAVRVAAAAGAGALVTTGHHDPWAPAALRGSAGLHFALPVIRLPPDQALALADSRCLVALDSDGADVLGQAPVPPGALLAFGSERAGLSDALLGRASRRVRIPMSPGVSSLNLATAVAVALYLT